MNPKIDDRLTRITQRLTLTSKILSILVGIGGSASIFWFSLKDGFYSAAILVWGPMAVLLLWAIIILTNKNLFFGWIFLVFWGSISFFLWRFFPYLGIREFAQCLPLPRICPQGFNTVVVSLVLSLWVTIGSTLLTVISLLSWIFTLKSQSHHNSSELS